MLHSLASLRPNFIGLIVATLLSNFPLGPANGGPPDSVVLTTGVEKAGRVVFENDELVILRQGSHDLKIKRGKIESVRSLERSLFYLLQHLVVVEPDDLLSLSDSAQLAEERELPGLASLVNLEILLADPLNEVAHEALGHRRRSSAWTAQLNGKWHLWRELLEMRREWNSAWQFETVHYSMRTNLPLKSAVQSLLDLESFYLFFHQTIGTSIESRNTVKPLAVHLHGDEQSYVQLGDNRPGWYDVNSFTVKVDGTSDYPRRSLFHEAVHQLLEVKSNGLISANSRIPAWLGEGLAEYLAYSAYGEPGRVTFEAGRLANGHLYTHSEGDDPETLDSLLALGVADFLSTQRAALRYSQSYTLVHYCLHGEHGRFRDAFLQYCRQAVAGKGSPTNFKKQVAKLSDDFEEGWSSYVSRLTGGR